MALLNYVELGDSTNQSIIIIHGLFGSHKNWSRISKQLALNFHVIVVDCRNHGDSFNSDTMNYQVMSNDVWLLTESLNLISPILIGHSMGGKIAMQLSNDHAGKFAQLIVVDIAPVDYSHRFDDIINPILNIDISNVSNRNEVDVELKKDLPEEFLRLFLLQSLAKVDGQLYWKIHWQALLDNIDSITQSPALVQQEDLECLFVFGEQSDYYSSKGLNAVKHYFPKANIQTIKDGNHWLHYQHANEFLMLLEGFLQVKSS